METARKKTFPQTDTAKATVFIVDDHAVVQHGFTQRINIEDDLQVCGTASTSEEAMDQIARLKPQVALIDLSLGRGDGLDLIKQLKSRGDQIRVLVISGHDEGVYAERSIRAGAHGYLHKAQAIDEVVDAIRTVLAGNLYLSDDATHRTLKRVLASPGTPVNASPVDGLSDRELQVYEMLGQGLSIKEIGERLFLSPKTIETYRGHLKRKLNLESSSELMRHAIQWSMEHA